MSFILDALKKSQSTRQQQSGPGTIAVETARGAPQAHNWLAIVVGIVALNLVVIALFAWFITRDTATNNAISDAAARNQQSQDGQMRPPATRQNLKTDTSSAQSSGSYRGEVRPLSAEVRESNPEASTPSATQSAAPAAVNPPAPVGIEPTPSEKAGILPTLAELQLDRRIQLSPLHIDVHVYNENPQRRFVLINARKYKEGERLSEGPLLEEIRRDGLVMYYRDQRFLVPRD